MRGRELKEKLQAAGYGVDTVGHGGGGFCTCHITLTEVRKIVGNKKWKPSGVDSFEYGVFRFWVNPPLKRR